MFLRVDVHQDVGLGVRHVKGGRSLDRRVFRLTVRHDQFAGLHGDDHSRCHILARIASRIVGGGLGGVRPKLADYLGRLLDDGPWAHEFIRDVPLDPTVEVILLFLRFSNDRVRRVDDLLEFVVLDRPVPRFAVDLDQHRRLVGVEDHRRVRFQSLREVLLVLDGGETRLHPVERDNHVPLLDPGFDEALETRPMVFGDVWKPDVRHVDIDDPDRTFIAVRQDTGVAPDHSENRGPVALGERDRNGRARTQLVPLKRFDLGLIDEYATLGVLEFPRPTESGLLGGDRCRQQKSTQCRRTKNRSPRSLEHEHLYCRSTSGIRRRSGCTQWPGGSSPPFRTWPR